MCIDKPWERSNSHIRSDLVVIFFSRFFPSLSIHVYLDLILRSRIDYWLVMEESSMVAITRRLYQTWRSTEYMEDFLSYSRTLSAMASKWTSERDKGRENVARWL